MELAGRTVKLWTPHERFLDTEWASLATVGARVRPSHRGIPPQVLLLFCLTPIDKKARPNWQTAETGWFLILWGSGHSFQRTLTFGRVTGSHTRNFLRWPAPPLASQVASQLRHLVSTAGGQGDHGARGGEAERSVKLKDLPNLFYSQFGR